MQTRKTSRKPRITEHRPRAASVPAENRSLDERQSAGPEALHAMFNYSLVPARYTLFQRARALFATTVSLMFPLTYLALTVSAVISTAHHMTAHFSWLTHPAWPALAVCYTGLAVGGTALSLLLIKPLAAEPILPSPQPEADPKKDPLFFLLTEKIARCVGVSAPDHIYFTLHPAINYEKTNGGVTPNAGQYHLTLGLPLVGALTVEQLSYLIATKMTEKSPRFSLPGFRMVGEVQHVLEHATYQKDRWDQIITQAIHRSNGFNTLLWVAAEELVNMSRHPLRLLNTGHSTLFRSYLVTHHSTLMQHARFIAGHAESEAAHSVASRQLAAHKRIENDLAHLILQGTPSRNLPLAIIHQALTLEKHTTSKVTQDTRNQPLKASALTHRYDSLCHLATRQFWAEHPIYPKSEQQPISQSPLPSGLHLYPLLSPVDAKFAIDRYFCGAFHPDRQIVPSLKSINTPLPTSAAKNTLRHLIDIFNKHRHEYILALKYNEQAVRGEGPVHQLENVQQHLWDIERVAELRLTAGLGLYLKHAAPDKYERIALYIESLNTLKDAQPHIDLLKFHLQQLRQRLEKRKQRHSAQNELDEIRLLEKCRCTYSNALAILATGRFAFPGGDNSALIIQYFQRHVGAPELLTERIEKCLSASAFIDTAREVHMQILGTLTAAALQVEVNAILQPTPQTDPFTFYNYCQIAVSDVAL